jgi:GNAT superfamily N-acetyltransferase
VNRVDVVELSERTWPALVDLFGPNGAVAGCWCTWFLQSPRLIGKDRTDANRELLHDRLRSGVPVGLLAMSGEQAVGWVAVAPRPSYPRLATSQIAKPAAPAEDLADVWSVTCFYVRKGMRRNGIAGVLLAGAVDCARRHGARAIEGYPVVTDGARVSSGELYHGTLGVFQAAGFATVEQRSPKRALVRREPV